MHIYLGFKQFTGLVRGGVLSLNLYCINNDIVKCI